MFKWIHFCRNRAERELEEYQKEEAAKKANRENYEGGQRLGMDYRPNIMSLFAWWTCDINGRYDFHTTPNERILFRTLGAMERLEKKVGVLEKKIKSLNKKPRSK